MRLSITASETYTLTAQTIDKIIRAGDSDVALLYLYMLRTQGKSTNEEAAKALSMSIGEINTATALLSRMGLIEVEPETGETSAKTGTTEETKEVIAQPCEYTQEEVLEKVETDSDFSVVVDETTRRLGKPLSSDELLRLYGIYDNLRLPTEVILQLITHCINECRYSGSGRPPSVRYIEKAAFTWEREGIFSIERAEEYLKALEQKRSLRGKVKQVLQIRDREFSETEKKYVDMWITMGFEPEAIAEAYDRTVMKTGALKYPYMDTILKSWNNKGLHTLEQILEKDGRKPIGRLNIQDRNPAKHGAPNREQLERMSRLIKKMDGE